MPKPPYHHGDLRLALVQAALRIIAKGGLDPLTLREVARQAGVSPAAPYSHFKDKRALLAAVAEEGFRSLDRAMRAAAARHRTPRAKLEAIGRAYIHFAVAHRAHFAVMFSSALIEHWQESPLAEVSLATFTLLVDAVRAVLHTAGRPHLDPIPRALLGWSTVHGLSSLWLEGPITRVTKPTSLTKLAQQIVHLSAEAVLA